MDIPPLIGPDEFAAALSSSRRKVPVSALAMYSSWLDGIVTDPALMVVPADDHVVHRGDGVFEAMKCVGGNFYLLDAHLERLAASARTLKLQAPASEAELKRKIFLAVRAGRAADCLVRVYISRGPGSFTAKPSDCPCPQLYIVVTTLPRPFMDAHPQGATLHLCAMPQKHPFFAVIKSCNYLQNALMEMEVREAGADFGVGLDADGFLTEGATENIGVVTRKKELLFPPLKSVLKGTTMTRAAKLASELVRRGALRSVAFRDLPAAALTEASEVLLFGTTIDVVAVVEIDGAKVGDAAPGPIWKALSEMLRADMRNNKAMLTPAFE